MEVSAVLKFLREMDRRRRIGFFFHFVGGCPRHAPPRTDGDADHRPLKKEKTSVMTVMRFGK